MKYFINGRERDLMYVLADEIYPDYAIFVKKYTDEGSQKQKAFASLQEAVRKDVVRAFRFLLLSAQYYKFHCA